LSARLTEARAAALSRAYWMHVACMLDERVRFKYPPANVLLIPSGGGERKAKMTLSVAQLLGMSDTVQKTMEQEREPMKATGYNPDAMEANLKKVHDDFVAEDARQEDLKRDLRDSTRRLEALKKQLYNLTSGGVDALLTAVDRSSPSGKIIRRLRSRITRPDSNEAPAVKPVPEKIG
jgi:hypothetical protein